MYYIEIKTKNNLVKMLVDSYYDEEFIKLLERNDIISIYIEQKSVAFAKKLKL